MNLATLYAPSAAKGLPEGSKERALSRLAMRQWWHAVFDPCPRLLRAAQPQEWKLLEPFLEHAAERRLSMRWSLHGQLLLWLNLRDDMAPEQAQELLAAAAARWCVSDQTSAQGILIRTKDLSVAGWKGSSPAQAHRVVLARLEKASALEEPIEYAVIAGRAYPEAPAWRSLPD